MSIIKGQVPNHISSYVQLKGNLTEDARIFGIESGKECVGLKIAAADSYYNAKEEKWEKRETVFHNNVIAMTKNIKNIEELKKGTPVVAEGSISYNSKDGSNGYSINEATFWVTNLEINTFGKVQEEVVAENQSL